MKVIDSSSLIKFFSKEKNWEKVASIISEGVMTLDLAIKEVANALWKKAIKEEITEELAIRIVSDLLKKEAILVVSQDEYIIEALRISIKSKIPIYDSLFIALAKMNKLELITSDKKQYEVALREGVNTQLV
ncbi:MAG: type II toxin-antitoxin system VapC family toxin [Sulfolobaceae archaeon]